MGNTLRSLATPSAIDTALNLVRQQTRRLLAEGGAAPPSPKHAKPDLAPRDFVLPLDVDAEEVRKAIEAKLGASPQPAVAPPVIERRAGGRLVVPARHLLRLGDGRFDRGREFIRGLVKQIRARRMRRTVPITDIRAGSAGS